MSGWYKLRIDCYNFFLMPHLNFSKIAINSLIIVSLLLGVSCEKTQEINIGITQAGLERFLEVNGYVKRDELKDFLTWEQVLAALGDTKSKLYQELMILGERDNARVIHVLETSFKNPNSNTSQAIKSLMGLTDKEVQELKDIIQLHKFIAQLKKLSDTSSVEAKVLNEFLQELSAGKGRLLGVFGDILKGEADAISVANLNTITIDKLCLLTAILARCPTYAEQKEAIRLLFETEKANFIGAIHGNGGINKNLVHEDFCKKEGVVPTIGPTLGKIFVYDNIVYKCSAPGPAGTAKMTQLKTDGTDFDTEVVLGGAV